MRPFARELLEAANEDFEVIVFTASQRAYADKVIDYLDPTGRLVHHRLYREHCTVVGNVLVKDLRVLANRQQQDLLIVDNAAVSFVYQLDNGVPIRSWFGDPADQELAKLQKHLKRLACCKDLVRENARVFDLRGFHAACRQRTT